MQDSRDTAVGYLIVSVSTARNAIPIENALVTVSSVDANGVEELLYTTRTNRSGQTAELPLPAPPQSASLTPGSGHPYARYTVTVDYDGYQPVSSSDLTIFADIVATLPVYLIPLEESAIPPVSPEVRVFPSHSLNTQEE